MRLPWLWAIHLCYVQSEGILAWRGQLHALEMLQIGHFRMQLLDAVIQIYTIGPLVHLHLLFCVIW